MFSADHVTGAKTVFFIFIFIFV